MALRDDIPEILKTFEENKDLLQHNSDLFEIYEGELKKFIVRDIQAQLSDKSFNIARFRISPINILIQIVDKLSKIYTKPPIRTVENGNDQDLELLRFYEEHMQIDAQLNIGNELFNLHKTVHWEPFVDSVTGNPKFRSIPSDRSLVMGLDKSDPMRRTHWIKIMGNVKLEDNRDKREEERTLFFVYTDTEFLPVDSKGDVRQEILNDPLEPNPNGVNSFGVIPSSYLNRSYHNIIPLIDTDILTMTKLFPVMLSDLNFAVMMQAFSIIFGIDVDNKNLVMAPNAFWDFKSDPKSKNKPEIGQIKPQVDILPVFQYIGGLLAFWLKSKNIRPGSVGALTPENMASGISKIVDEMDTFEDRQKQVSYFKAGEADFWFRLLNHMHPEWLLQKRINTKLKWSPSAKVVTSFQEQRPNIKRSEILGDVVIELDKGLTTRKIGIKRLNPEMGDEAIDKLIQEVREENTIVITRNSDNGDDNGNEVAETKDTNTGHLEPEQKSKARK